MKSKLSLSLHQQHSQASTIQHQDYCEQITDYRQSIHESRLVQNFLQQTIKRAQWTEHLQEG